MSVWQKCGHQDINTRLLRPDRLIGNLGRKFFDYHDWKKTYIYYNQVGCMKEKELNQLVASVSLQKQVHNQTYNFQKAKDRDPIPE